jgi:hypothetical protein
MAPARPNYAAQIGNIYFLSRLGSTLREATADIPHTELPAEIQLLLRRLERLEVQQERRDARCPQHR